MSTVKKVDTKQPKNNKNANPRQGWKQRIQKELQTHGNKKIDTEWLNASLTDDSNWEW